MPTTMTNAEMTAFLNNDAAARAEARTLANITRRASTLFDDGYTATQEDACFYTILTPEQGRYTVHVNDDAPADEVFGNFCTCPAHEKYKTCKHLQAVLNQRAQEAYLLAAYEARQDNDDDRYPEL